MGRHLAQALLRRGDEVTLYCRKKETLLEKLLPNVKVVEGELADQTKLRQALHQQDILYYFVSMTDVQSSLTDIHHDSQNIALFLHVMEVCKDVSTLKKVLFASSGGTVYGEPNHVPTTEEEHLRPLSPYGVSKVSMENYLRYYHHQYGMNYVICRYANPYGPLQIPFKKVGAIAAFLYQHLKGEKVTIYGNPDEIIRDYLYISDAIEATIALSHQEKLPHHVYNIGSSVGYSLQHLIQSIEHQTGRPLSFHSTIHPKQNVKRIILDCSRIYKDVGWRPVVSLQEGLIQMEEWIAAYIRNEGAQGRTKGE
ncbi:UDP-glucose 4-epimerase [Fictibacillus macauensis ZFHKF-1]|uniref:UDP-glucose 4-epimerase n=2 Tax=Fictibacillus TaxID=1329200 RepID=I8UCV1_9BACL|nr:UDP-glucose 4-epimerase [Fictibacillus macauensis ZFHKF-1]